MFNNTNISSIISKYLKNKKNIGSSEAQITIFTYYINNLNVHFKKHHKDYHSRRGLINIVNKRKKLLLYLKKNNNKKYFMLIKKLKLRK